MARAEPAIATTDIAGRWVAAERKLVLDVSRCGAGWCGVEVVDTACGRTALRLDAGEQRDAVIQFAGRLERAAGTQPYAVRATLYRRREDGTIALSMAGNTGSEFQAMRRTFPFSALLVRAGDPACTPSPKVSLR